MASNLWKRTGFSTLILVAVLSAQQSAEPTAPKFEVVSIHAVPPNAPPIMREVDFTPILPGGQYVDSRTPLLVLIAFAYQVKEPDRRLSGLPKWAQHQSYAITAKPSEGFPMLSKAENQEQVRLMMRAMLAERFHLQMHSEFRQGSILHLTVAKGGIKVKEVNPPVPPEKEQPVGAAVGDYDGHMIGSKSTMQSLAGALGIFLKLPVVDQTGLAGYYDFDIRWKSSERPQGQSSSLGAEGESLLISNLQSQFGLRLTRTTGPLEYWVVDHVEPPTEN